MKGMARNHKEFKKPSGKGIDLTNTSSLLAAEALAVAMVDTEFRIDDTDE